MTIISGVINNISEGVLDMMFTGNNKVAINVDSIAVGKRILEENEKYKVICFNFESGKGLPNHSHHGEASILVWDGRVNIEFNNGEKCSLIKGDFLRFDARVEHSVIAEGLTKVIITIQK